MSESWKIDPKTRDYVMAGGAPVPTTDIKVPAFYRLKIHRGRWLYAPDDRYGSDFYLVKKRFNGKDLGGLTNIAEKALQPLIDDGRASAVEVVPDTRQQQSRNNAFMEIEITDAQGEVQKLDLPPIGGT